MLITFLVFGLFLAMAGKFSLLSTGFIMLTASSFVNLFGKNVPQVDNASLLASCIFIFIGLIVHHLNRGWVSPKN